MLLLRSIGRFTSFASTENQAMNKSEALVQLRQYKAGFEFFREELRRQREEIDKRDAQLATAVNRCADFIEIIADSQVSDFAEIASGSIDDFTRSPGSLSSESRNQPE